MRAQDWMWFRGDRVEILVGDDKGKQGIINYIVQVSLNKSKQLLFRVKIEKCFNQAYAITRKGYFIDK